MLFRVNDDRIYIRYMAEAVNHLPVTQEVWIQSQVTYVEFSMYIMATGQAFLTEFRFIPVFLSFYQWHFFIYSFITDAV